MAYMNQEKKSKIAPVVKKILAKYGLKGSLSVDNHSTLILNITQGRIDFLGNHIATAKASPGFSYEMERSLWAAPKDYLPINTYWYHDHFTGQAKAALRDLIVAMNNGNHDNSDARFDYFDVGWYVNINVGKWNKPYVLIK